MAKSGPKPTSGKKPTPAAKKPAPKAGGTGARKAEMRTYYRENKAAARAAKTTAMTTGDKTALKAFRSAQRSFVAAAKPAGGYKGATPVKLPPSPFGGDKFGQKYRQYKQGQTPKPKPGLKPPPPMKY